MEFLELIFKTEKLNIMYEFNCEMYLGLIEIKSIKTENVIVVLLLMQKNKFRDLAEKIIIIFIIF